MKTVFIVTKPSGIHLGTCLLGQGETKNDALCDAFGPKPWSKWQKQSARSANVFEATEEDLELFN